MRQPSASMPSRCLLCVLRPPCENTPNSELACADELRARVSTCSTTIVTMGDISENVLRQAMEKHKKEWSCNLE